MADSAGPRSVSPQGDRRRRARADRLTLEKAAEDYLEGLYRAEPERIDRSVDPLLIQFGYWREKDSAPWQPLAHDFKRLRNMAMSWNAEKWLPADAPRKIELLDSLDKIAAVMLTAWWGVDTLLCVRQDDGTWRIQCVLWQSVPDGA